MLSAPVLTAAVEWPLWGVELTRLQYAGAVIVLGGLAVLIRLESRASAQAKSPCDAPGSTGYGSKQIETALQNSQPTSSRHARKDHLA